MTLLLPPEIRLTDASDVSQKALTTYYQEVYPEQFEVLSRIWSWKYRISFFDGRIPLLLVKDQRVIAQAGMIPVRTLLGNDTFTASWFIDFTVSDDFQRQGLGTILTKKWMSFADLQITFCNEKSIGVFRKLGWTENQDSFLHINILSPADLPQVPGFVPQYLRRLLGRLTRPVMKWWYRRHALPRSEWQIREVSEATMADFRQVYEEAEKEQEQSNRLTIKRDADFIQWRVLSSPEKSRYFLFSAGGIQALVAPKSGAGLSLDVLWINDLRSHDRIIRLLSSLSVYGLEKGYAYLRLHTSSEMLSQRLKRVHRPLIRRPLFACYSDHPKLSDRLHELQFDWQLIDSDFERFSQTDPQTMTP